MTDAPEGSDGSSRSAAKGYTAVVVFHGMGQQRHYELLWRVVESLDAYVLARAKPGAKHIHKRLMLKTRRERLNASVAPTQDELVYVEAAHAGDPQAQRVRFYEGYWAPATVDGTSAASVLAWLIGQIPRPLKVLYAPWRSFGRLRRADLMNLLHKKISTTSPDSDQPDFARLVLQRYSEFTGRRPPEPGSFASFVDYLAKETKDEALRAQMIEVALKWRRKHQWSLLRHAGLLLFVGLSIASLGALAVLGSLEALQVISGWSWPRSIGISLEADFGTAVSLILTLAIASGVAGFLRDAVGDVQQFVTYQETEVLHERRARIMEEAGKTLRHVLTDPTCNRVVVFAHSLGSAVALDSILALRAHNEAAAPTASAGTHMGQPLPLHKIEHLITCGSPIDKINFFFATLNSQVTGFERMVDELRGDIGNVPFSKAGRQPHIHWVNFWDQGDPISGPLETVMPAELRKQRVDNVRVAAYPFPDIAASHDAYFEEHAVVRHLYRVSFWDQSSFAHPPRKDEPGALPNYDWVGPGRASPLQSGLMLLVPLLMGLVIWTTVGVVFPQVLAPRIELLGILAGALLAAGLLQRKLRPRSLGDASPSGSG